jgi:hypothetical protein
LLRSRQRKQYGDNEKEKKEMCKMRNKWCAISTQRKFYSGRGGKMAYREITLLSTLSFTESGESETYKTPH